MPSVHTCLNLKKALRAAVTLSVSQADDVILRAHRILTLSFGPGVGSDLRADREPSLGFDPAGPTGTP
jgi:hypothetical protein